jgi:hypothetical protein
MHSRRNTYVKPDPLEPDVSRGVCERRTHVCKLAASRAPRRIQTTAGLMHFVVRSRDVCLLGLRVAKIGARLIAAQDDPAHTDKTNECWDCERMGALDEGSGLGWSRSRGRQRRNPPRASLAGVTMFVERHQRSTSAASRCNHHDICGGRKGKARKLTPSLLSAWVPADRWGTWASGDDGYEEVWHAATGPANQAAIALPCACPTRIWFAHFLGFRQRMQVGLYHTGRPLSRS